VEFLIGTKGSPRFSTDTLRLFIVGKSLHISAIEVDDAVYDQIQDIILKLADYLPHTPVSAFGINYIFEADKGEMEFDFFALPDLDQFKESEYAIKQNSLKHIIRFDDLLLNLSITDKDEIVNFSFNYHFEIDSLTILKEKVTDNNLLALRKKSEDLLTDLYLTASD